MLTFLFWGYFCHNGVDRKSQIVKNMINDYIKGHSELKRIFKTEGG